MAVVVALAALTGCGAGPGIVRTPSSSVATPSLPAGVSIPANGWSLRNMGVVNGPAALSVPAGSQFAVRADTSQEVTLVFAAPAAAAVADYLRTALPGTGFTITADRDGAMTFAGYGWTGTYLVTGDLCALTVRPG